ncbi:hypothetical protein HK101_008922 [Irineochytrium annulatum]|nr:hypothetical protein HK101_008922 [Irineochytrium annulatum]
MPAPPHGPTAVSSLNSGPAPASPGSPTTDSITAPAAGPATIIHHKPTPSDVFEESVYSLIPVEYTPPAKQNMYRSKFAGHVRKEYVSGKKEAASMGPAKVEVNRTDGFLRKGDREKLKPKDQGLMGSHVSAEPVVGDKTIRKAPVPKEPGPMMPKTGKDFIKQNALENINSSAKKPLDNTVAYRNKKDYGATPSYLMKRMKIQDDVKAAIESEQKSAGENKRDLKEGVVPLPEDERLRILEGLKANWEKLNSDYQKLSLTVDTVPKIARKVNMEQQLKHLEDHIAKFSHPSILVNFNTAYR